MARRIKSWDSGRVCVLGPGQGVDDHVWVEQHLERAGVLDAQLVAFIEVDLGEQPLVAQTTVRVVAAGVEVGAVLQQVEGVIEVGAGVGIPRLSAA